MTNHRILDVVMVVLGSMLLGCCVAAQQYFSVKPSNTTAAHGDEYAVFLCTVEDKTGKLSWEKGSIGSIIYIEDSGVSDDDKYDVSGNHFIGQYDLTIYDIVINDDDEYICKISGLLPGLSIEASGDGYESLGSENEYDGAYYGTITTQDLHIAVQAEHNCASYQCEGNNTQFTDTILSNEETLYVYFPPNEPSPCTTSLRGPTGNITAGDIVTLQCTSCSSNPIAHLTWYQNNIVLNDGISLKTYVESEYNGMRTVQYYTLTTSQYSHGFTYICEAFNDEFQDVFASTQIQLDVHYAPITENRVTNSRCATNLTEQVNIICEINSNPESVITWLDQYNETLSNDTGKIIIREKYETVLKTSILTIMSVEESDFGEYYCVARNYIGSIIQTVLFSEICKDNVNNVDARGIGFFSLFDGNA
ncbi:myelin-associated glycoprotein-like [Saccoglossus kowalevskii]